MDNTFYPSIFFCIEIHGRGGTEAYSTSYRWGAWYTLHKSLVCLSAKSQRQPIYIHIYNYGQSRITN